MGLTRTLLIEKNWTLRLLIENHLRRFAQLEVEAVDEVQAGLERAALGQYHIVIVSLELDGISPARLIQSLSAVRPAPLILTVARSERHAALAPETAGVIHDMLSLPISRTTLTLTITRAIDHIQAQANAAFFTNVSKSNGGTATEGKRSARRTGSQRARIGRYDLNERLGGGKAGTVFSGSISSTGRTVAVRLLPRGLLERLGTTRVWKDWLAREASAAAAVTHPHVAAVLDHGTSDDEPIVYLVSELAEGEPLSRKLEHGPLSPAAALKTASQIAGALAAVHEAGFAHRLVRPSNVLLGAGGDAVLTDLGVAGVLAWDLLPLRDRLDTMPFLSPEQLRFGHVDDRSDQFSLGLVLHEALTGRSCFGGRSPTARVRSILTDAPDLALGGVSDAREDLRAILGTMLAQRPEDRYQGDAELQSALASCAERLGGDH
jgi:DNA-binding response OmpR family regulator